MSLVDLGKRLLESAKQGETEEVRQLMTNGAPFTTDWLGTSPLHMAAQYGHLATAEVLLRAGMSRDARTKVDRTPLHVAAQEGHLDIVELLLRHGADIEAKDMLKMTPLHWAVEKGNTDVVLCLLGHGADVNALSKFEKSPIDIAIDTQRPALVQLIQEYAQESVQVKQEVATIKNDPLITQVTNSVSVSPVIVKTVEAVPKTQALNTTAKKVVLTTVSSSTTQANKNATTTTPVRAIATKMPNARPILLHANLANLQRAAAAAAAAAAAVGAHSKTAVSEDSGDSADQSSTSVLATLAALAEVTAPNNAVSTADALQWLETHGISMLPADNSTIVASALEGGQTLSLTEAGKLALDWVKDNNTRISDAARSSEDQIASTIQDISANTTTNQKVITIVADQSQLPSIINSAQNTPIVVVSGSPVKATDPNSKVSWKNETASTNGKIDTSGGKSSGDDSCEQLQKELEEMRRKAEEYRKQLEQKEREAEVYRKQLEEMKTSQK